MCVKNKKGATLVNCSLVKPDKVYIIDKVLFGERTNSFWCVSIGKRFFMP